ncbi:MAG: hypothetical protein HGA85_02635 [Nanoarchaeota archaeon]|nr:hypothetical protein [Nanoarchaeota archaeon]
MTSITQTIWKCIDEDVVARRALEKGIAGHKSLALYLLKEYRLGASIDAVISAIRRYDRDTPLESRFAQARKVILGSTDIRLISNTLILSVEKNKRNQELLGKVFSSISYEKGELLLIIQGEETLKVIINEKNKGKITALFGDGDIVSIVDHLALLTVNLTKDAVKTPGIIAVLSTELTINDINVIEMMSCLPEMMFFVKQKDVLKAYKILFDMCNR